MSLEAIAELEEHQAYIEEVAERRLWNKALKAGVDATPEGAGSRTISSATNEDVTPPCAGWRFGGSRARGGSSKSQIPNPKQTPNSKRGKLKSAGSVRSDDAGAGCRCG